MAPPSPAAALMEELVEQVLLRIPPDDPASLVRAALACKPWCRLVADAGFRRRYRAFHRTPPLLGVCYFRLHERSGIFSARFVPTSPFRHPCVDLHGMRALDARHGRVLLRAISSTGAPFLVWDPTTDELQDLPILHPLRSAQSWNAAVLCSATGPCDHLDCHRGPFSVFVAFAASTETCVVYVYSSEDGRWSHRATLHAPDKMEFDFAGSAFAENALYFQLCFTKALKNQLDTHQVSLIDRPPTELYGLNTVLMTTEDGKLGCATLKNSRLHLLSREVGPNTDARWTLSRVIELQTLLHGHTLSSPLLVIGIACGARFIFMKTDDALFIIDPKSVRVRKIFMRIEALFPCFSILELLH
ncbi:hypothetical protein ACP70R_036029 [Stipagrostis hirtigluma subsp. patula]